MKISKQLIIILVLIVIVFTKLNVYMPYKAVQKFAQLRNARGRQINQNKTSIQYNLANFGHIPYGQPMQGTLFLPNNKKFCDIDQRQFRRPDNPAYKNFMLIQRGDCKFTKKIILAQNLNIHLVIIYDNDTTATKPSVVMANDGHGHLVQIPSIFITNQDAVDLMKAYQYADNKLILLINFDTGLGQTANTTFFLDPGHRQGYIMLRDFYNNYFSYVKHLMNVDLAFNVQESCFYCQQKDCVNDKRIYCYDKDEKHPVNATGKQIIQEYLRSYFLKQMDKSPNKQIWWQYMIQIDEQLCFGRINQVKNCALKILKDLKIDTEALQEKVKKEMQEANSSILKRFVNMSQSAGILYYPQASINNKTYFGIFKAPEIFDMVCNSLVDPPYECVDIGGRKVHQQTNYGFVILFIVLGMSGAFILILIVYTKLIKRQVNVQLSSQVNKMVQNYVALTEQKSNSHVDKSKQAL